MEIVHVVQFGILVHVVILLLDLDVGTEQNLELLKMTTLLRNMEECEDSGRHFLKIFY